MCWILRWRISRRWTATRKKTLNLRIIRQHNNHPRIVVGAFYYFSRGKPGHMEKNCRLKRQPPPQVNNTKEAFIAMITEVNLVGGADGRWVDTSASRHVYYDRTMLKTYTDAYDKMVLLRDSHTTNITRIENVELMFTMERPYCWRMSCILERCERIWCLDFYLKREGDPDYMFWFVNHY